MGRTDIWNSPQPPHARHYNQRIFIIPEKASEEIMCFHDSRKATGNIILWYTGTHYDYLRPSDNIPEAITTQ
jgi:hypothetical protein